ncbi:MAG TPA: thiamine pyrophosphate-dependent dehydrogenase E1 component subunit alpha [Chloroflexota bacterium]|jgi:pyruvate dehydrogenase E1 component alpha subunit|nr:thiamine pyrophosphate-dependent dehydrogenase E1 component subunit alpha [Chloroflexota bacterium]
MELIPELALRLLRDMLLIRRTEERVAEVYPEQEMRCPVHLCIGQEAVPAGVCSNLTREDYAMGGHRAHGHYLAKGGDLAAMIAEFYGKASGCSGGIGGSMHLMDLAAGFLGATPILGSTIPIAVGAALGSVMRGEDRVTVAFFGDAATEEGAFHESLNFAALRKLPIVFVCENNLYSVQSPMSVRQPATREIYQLAQGHGIESRQSDGNDVLAVYELAKSAVEKARSGGGPTFLEFMTYRWREHCGPNFDHEVRPYEDYELWLRRCPIERLRSTMLASGLVAAELNAVATSVEFEVEAALAVAKAGPFPKAELLLEGVYAA